MTDKEFDYMFLPINADKDLVREIEEIQSYLTDKVAGSKQAVKEFAEKLKKIVFEQGNPYNVPYEEFSQANVLFMVIDELLKEDEE